MNKIVEIDKFSMDKLKRQKYKKLIKGNDEKMKIYYVHIMLFCLHFAKYFT